MDGFLNVLKPPGMTSHDVVNEVRRIVGVRRVGHTGTLDPDVPGVLVVGIGQAVRLNEYLLDADKAYRCEITFGIATETGDATGEVTARQPAPGLAQGAVEGALRAFVGTYEQIPPMVSAVKVGGRRLYELARRGADVPREPRRVTIHALTLVSFSPGEYPRALFDVFCSKGTYVRALCEDIGRRLGVPAHMSYLVRTRSGPFRLEAARPLQEIAADVRRCLLPLTAALPDLPRLRLSAERAALVGRGVPPGREWFQGVGELPARAALIGPDGRLLAIVERDRGSGRPYRYAKVLCGGE